MDGTHFQFKRYVDSEPNTLSTKLKLKLYCRYEYTKPGMINRIWGLNNYDFRWMDMLDFICNGSADLFGTGRERKI